MAQKPTVGRIVHYVNKGHSLGTTAGTCRAGIVTEVKNGTTVSCAVFTPRGTLFYEELTYDAGKATGTWHWPETEDGPTSAIFPAKMRRVSDEPEPGTPEDVRRV